MSDPNSNNYKPATVSNGNGDSLIGCFGFDPNESSKKDPRLKMAKNPTQLGGIVVEGIIPSCTLPKKIVWLCVYCANQACVNNPDFNPEPADTEED